MGGVFLIFLPTVINYGQIIHAQKIPNLEKMHLPNMTNCFLWNSMKTASGCNQDLVDSEVAWFCQFFFTIQTYQCEQIQKQVSIFTNDVETLATNIHKVMKFLTHFFASIDDINHVGCQNKGCSISLEIAKHLSISEKFAKVNMKQMSTLFHHNVVIVPITDA